MYNGKYSERQSSGKRAARRRRRRIRNTALSLALILLLGMAIGGTIAYLTRDGGSVTNNFVPGEVAIDIHEGFNETTGVKSSIEIENTNDSNIPVYIRVALVGNWADAEDKICINHQNDPLSSLTLGENWKKGSDGFYYYTKSVAVGEKTSDLLKDDITLSEANDGCCYQLEVVASAIQADGETDGQNPIDAVVNAWGIAPTSLK